MNIEAGVLDDGFYDLGGAFGLPFGLTKADRQGYGGEISDGHQIEVHVIKAAAVRWQVENSWDAEHGEKGYFVMSAGWLENYVDHAAIRREVLSPELKATLSAPPSVFPPWEPDPMQVLFSTR